MKKPLWREKTKDKLFAISFPSLYTFSLQLRSNKRYSPLTKKKKRFLETPKLNKHTTCLKALYGASKDNDPMKSHYMHLACNWLIQNSSS